VTTSHERGGPSAAALAGGRCEHAHGVAQYWASCNLPRRKVAVDACSALISPYGKSGHGRGAAAREEMK
jgi:hypothetical protein